MRQAVGAGILLWVAVFLPAFLFSRGEELSHPLGEEQSVNSTVEMSISTDSDHTLRLWDEGAVREMSVEEYLATAYARACRVAALYQKYRSA